MSSQNPELVAALTDVRRAYRLLWAFQKRILEYNRIITDRLDFKRWATKSIFETFTGNRDDHWIWGLLPMADIEFRASRRQDDTKYPDGKWWEYPRKHDAVLYSRLRADTGIPEGARVDPNPLTFKPVEQCETKLKLFLVLNREDRNEKFYFWNACDECRKMQPGKGTLQSPGIDIFGTEFDVSELGDEEALLAAVDCFKDAAGRALGLSLDELPNP